MKRGSFRDWRDARVDVEDYQELDIERILALLDLIGRGRASGVAIARARARADNPFHICDGRVTRLVLYFDGEHAFADLGLRA